MKIRSVEDIEDNFNAFCNNFHTLSNYHRDFSTEEMIGIMKFLQALILFDNKTKAFNDKHNVNIAHQFRRMLNTLREIQDVETLERLENAADGQLNTFIKILQDRIEEAKAARLLKQSY